MRKFRIVISAENGADVCTAFKEFAAWTEAERFAVGLMNLVGGKTYSVFYA